MKFKHVSYADDHAKTVRWRLQTTMHGVELIACCEDDEQRVATLNEAGMYLHTLRQKIDWLPTGSGSDCIAMALGDTETWPPK